MKSTWGIQKGTIPKFYIKLRVLQTSPFAYGIVLYVYWHPTDSSFSDLGTPKCQLTAGFRRDLTFPAASCITVKNESGAGIHRQLCSVYGDDVTSNQMKHC